MFGVILGLLEHLPDSKHIEELGFIPLQVMAAAPNRWTAEEDRILRQEGLAQCPGMMLCVDIYRLYGE